VYGSSYQYMKRDDRMRTDIYAVIHYLINEDDTNNDNDHISDSTWQTSLQERSSQVGVKLRSMYIVDHFLDHVNKSLG
jgi:hypothetical protein